MKRKIDLSSHSKNKAYIGSILKAIRETNNLPQREIARKLGYSNMNFTSMIETGRSSPTIGKVPEIVKAINAESMLMPVILKYLYPEAWI